ncbi:hypothetical protein ACA910_013664 [Epithemia clementina (nom. ined.)]
MSRLLLATAADKTSSSGTSYPCDIALSMGIRDFKDLQHLVQLVTVPRPRPGLGPRSYGCRQLIANNKEEQQNELDQRNPTSASSSSSATKKKRVRFAEQLNKYHGFATSSSSNNDSGCNDESTDDECWYSAEDYDQFVRRLRHRVEQSCENVYIKPKLMILEKVHLGCMNSCFHDDDGNNNETNKDNGEDDCIVRGGVRRAELAQLYKDVDNLVGLEPYIAEYIPHWHDRHTRHDKIISLVVWSSKKASLRTSDGSNSATKETQNKLSRSLFRKSRELSVDEKSRRFSLGARIYAQEIAQASFASGNP